jgi:homoserine O-succinyltransferase
MTIVLAQGFNQADRCLHVGLVNNMPDSALAGTERQFLNLLEAAAPDFPVQVSFFSLPGIPRGVGGQQHLENNFYGSLPDLQEASLDSLIVTGTEPRLPALEDEPFWGPMTELFDWVEREGPPTTFSCLAAHAAVLHYDGVPRHRLPQKRFGMFDHVRVCRHELTDRLGPRVQVAHSRFNEVAGDALAECGYTILTQAPDAGVDLFIKDRRNICLFFQGHPEYDPETLGREYQRDVKRYFAGERESYPELPKDYFGPLEALSLARFQARAVAERRTVTMEDFPLASRRSAPMSGWRSPATDVFRTWLQRIVETKFGGCVPFIASHRRKGLPPVEVSRPQRTTMPR